MDASCQNPIFLLGFQSAPGSRGAFGIEQCLHHFYVKFIVLVEAYFDNDSFYGHKLAMDQQQ